MITSTKTRKAATGCVRRSVQGVSIAALLGAAIIAGPANAAPRVQDGQSPGYLGAAAAKLNSQRAAADAEATAQQARVTKNANDSVKFWFNVMLDANAIDFSGSPIDQAGPTRTSRAMAIVTIAVFDALNAFERRFASYNSIGVADHRSFSREAAIAYAAHDTLVALWPRQTARFDSLLADDLASINGGAARIARGKKVGQDAAAAILARRSADNSQAAERAWGTGGGAVADGTNDFLGRMVNVGSTGIGDWTPDPISGATVALGSFWGSVTPFALTSGNQFRLAPPPAVGTPAYAASFAEVAAIGGAPENAGTPSTSTPETRFVANYWGYDGVPGLGVPPRLYNQIALQVATDRGLNNALRLARFLAIVNVSLADSGIAAWDSKYFYNFWRPVVGIRTPDGAADTTNDPNWSPVGVSVINTSAAIRPTPPFPAYPSGHATFGASLFEVARDFFGDRPFTFVSDEYNGEGSDPFTPGTPRPLVPVRFSSFTEAQVENGVSRIYGGVHWDFDDIEGQKLGVRVARRVLDDIQPFSQQNNH